MKTGWKTRIDERRYFEEKRESQRMSRARLKRLMVETELANERSKYIPPEIYGRIIYPDPEAKPNPYLENAKKIMNDSQSPTSWLEKLKAKVYT